MSFAPRKSMLEHIFSINFVDPDGEPKTDRRLNPPKDTFVRGAPARKMQDFTFASNKTSFNRTRIIAFEDDAVSSVVSEDICPVIFERLGRVALNSA
jgi:hypothetical protein